jgi:hypothetical protein
VGALQKPEATNVAGIRTWNSLGRFVKRGEKGILILAPMVSKNLKKNQDAKQSDDAKQPESRLCGFRAVYVFDRLSPDLRPSLCAPDGCPEWMHFSIAVKHIIAQLLCPVQHSLMQEFQLSASFVHESGFSARTPANNS